MNLKDGFVLSTVGGSRIAVTINQAPAPFHGVVRLNDSGEFIWKALAEGLAPEQIEEKLMEEYEGLDAETAKKAVDHVVRQLRDAGILED